MLKFINYSKFKHDLCSWAPQHTPQDPPLGNMQKKYYGQKHHVILTVRQPDLQREQKSVAHPLGHEGHLLWQN
jgi:hypothetical protein